MIIIIYSQRIYENFMKMLKPPLWAVDFPPEKDETKYGISFKGQSRRKPVTQN